MENNREIQAIKDRCSINLLAYIIRNTLEKGYDAVTIDRLNEVLLLAEDRVIDPKSMKELEVM